MAESVPSGAEGSGAAATPAELKPWAAASAFTCPNSAEFHEGDILIEGSLSGASWPLNKSGSVGRIDRVVRNGCDAERWQSPV